MCLHPPPPDAQRFDLTRGSSKVVPNGYKKKKENEINKCYRRNVGIRAFNVRVTCSGFSRVVDAAEFYREIDVPRSKTTNSEQPETPYRYGRRRSSNAVENGDIGSLKTPDGYRHPEGSVFGCAGGKRDPPGHRHGRGTQTTGGTRTNNRRRDFFVPDPAAETQTSVSPPLTLRSYFLSFSPHTRRFRAHYAIRNYCPGIPWYGRNMGIFSDRRTRTAAGRREVSAAGGGVRRVLKENIPC